MVARVRLLDDAVINQIAAGEVIERPASVIKELVENAVDAGATRVDVEVEKGGRALISVIDDGSGMSREDALMALERHATSKIRDAGDLFAIQSLGFRGEAVPSIAAVSRFELITGEEGDVAGTRIVVEGGRVETVEDAPNPGGTEIRVRRLFFNTPVRTRFLRSPRTEMAHVVEAVQRLALAAPSVAFRLVSDGRTVLDAPRAHDLRTRAAAIVGKKAAAGLIPLQAERGELRLEGLVSDPSLHRAANNALYLYVNGRFVKDRTLVGSVLSAYRGVIPRGRYPVVVLFLDLPPDRVDVNVHPTKVEVRFVDGSAVWRLVGAAVTDRLAAAMPGRESPDARPDASGPEGGPGTGGFGPVTGRGPLLPFGRSIASRAMDAAPPALDDGPADPLGRAAADDPDDAAGPGEGPGRACGGRAATWLDKLRKATEDGTAWGGGDRPRFAELRVLAQYDRTFLLCELGRGPGAGARGSPFRGAGRAGGRVAGRDSQLVVLDQHAAHERVMFERLRARAGAGKARTQRLLVPELLELDRSRTTALAEEAGPLLAEIGVEVSAFGDDVVALQGVPAGISSKRVRRTVEDLASEILAGAGRERRVVDELRYEIAALLACHSAVRAGDVLSPDEIRTLLVQLDAIDHAFACPHGRPTLVRFARDEVARWFSRDS